nr:uncharacterized protein LOC114822304 [Malus domestica]
MGENEAFSAYLVRLFDLLSQMRSYGEEISNQRIVQKLLISLPRSYDSIASVIENTKDLDTVDVQDVVPILKGNEQRIDRHDEIHTEKAFVSLNIAPKQNKYNGNQGFKPQKNWKSKWKKWDNRPANQARKAACASEGAKNPCIHCDKLHFGELKKCEDTWYVDSGCSNHMTRREDLLVDIDRTMTTKVEIGTGQLIEVIGKGNLVVETKMGRRYIKEVMLVPGLKENLLNVRQMMEHGYFLVFGGTTAEIYDDSSLSNLVAKIPMKGNMSLPLKLQLEMQIALKANVYFLRNKSEVFGIFKKFKSTVELQSGYRLKKLRSDRGGEYTSVEFREFCEEMGMERQLTVAYTPQENGVAERKNRTVVEMEKCMMIEKGVPFDFWVEAVNTIMYILNRCSTKSLDKKTPFEAYSGRKPRIKHLKIFGFICCAHIPNQLRQKLDETSTKCIFLGYGTCEKGYRLYDLVSKKIIVSRDVIVDENACWDWKSQSEKTINVPMPEGRMCEQREEGSSSDKGVVNDESLISSSETYELIENSSRLIPM